MRIELRRFVAMNSWQRVESFVGHLPYKPLKMGMFYVLRAEWPFAIPPPIRSIEVKESGIEDIEALVRVHPKGDVFTTRFGLGDRCLCAWEQGEIAGHFWFSIRPTVLEGRFSYPIEVPEDTVYAYDALVREPFRKCGILNQFWRTLGEWMATQGRHRISIIIDHDNVVSWKAHVSKGFYPTTKVVCVQCFGRNYRRVSPVQPGELPPLVRTFIGDSAALSDAQRRIPSKTEHV